VSEEQAFKITYETMSADNKELQAAFDAAIERVKGGLGQTYPQIIGGERRTSDKTFPNISPIDTDVIVGHFQAGTRADAADAIAAARAAFPAWRDTPYMERIALIRKAADMISQRRFELSAMMIMEMGKNRLEALGDVEESADLLRYYCHQMEQNKGFVRQMQSLSGKDHNTDVLKPYGVWIVISPFNFPLALAAGPVAAAMIAGNTVVFKPSSDAPLTGYELAAILVEAGLPAGSLNLVTGSGGTVGAELVENPGADGITFTGSYEVGFNQVYKRFARTAPKPVVVEMGGKNPTIVSDKADLDKATLGVVRSAFGMGGQKCSACSRAYVQRGVYDAFMKELIEKTKALKIGDPLESDTFLGPLVNKAALENFKAYVKKARQDGKIVYGGEVLSEGDMARGFYVEPTIVEGLPQDHALVQDELFVPILIVLPYDTLDEALEKANDSIYGLTAGFYSEDQGEIKSFLDRIEAGVVYVNRPGGATTGAWPGCQPFGGWKASGSSGRNIGGHYTLLNYLREQSQTVIVD
jgi:1-pyrroline-5-carboxylate dehydrogenase